MIESMNKAINSSEGPVKEKHVRKLLIGSYQAESGAFFWQYLPVIKLKENQIVCWKFCHVLHKMLRDGHRQVLMSSFERRQILLDCGNMWRHVEDGYGQLIYKYCTLLFNRINFLMRNSRFPNDLKVTDEQLDEIGERDASVFFDLSCEIFDALDDILRLQELVLVALDLKKFNSMASSGQCHLAPLVACIQDSSLLYDYSVKILFKLHSTLSPSTLEGHRDRFVCQHRALRNFYINASNLQYFKTLIQIPHLSDRHPNFLIASDLQQHVTPKVVMITTEVDRDSPDQVSRSSDGGSQLLVNIGDESADADHDGSISQHAMTSSENSLDVMLNQNNSLSDQSRSIMIERELELNNTIGKLEITIATLREQLETEKSNHTNTKQQLSSEIAQLKESYEEKLTKVTKELDKVKSDLTSLKYSTNSNKVELEKVQEECKRAKHDNDISQEAMKRLVKDLRELKTENATLRLKPAEVPEACKVNEAQVEELNKKLNELTLQLVEKNNLVQEWAKEKEALISSKVDLEKQLDTHQGDLLVAEMNETDKIIKEASKKIEELSEKSRKLETGIKLQVNEKISEVCSNLMKAVRNLIIQSRLLQREVVGHDEKTKIDDFYKRNSSWTEGLISAANVVAMAARSLVDSADRAMSGQARFSELAASAHEVAAATTQLVVASRVKANKDSEKLKVLTSAAKQVNQCTSMVVDTARVCAELIEQEIDKVDISTLSLHQTKKLEMETQVKLLELEDQLSKERIKLGLLRRQHYEQEEIQEAAAKSSE